MQVQVLPLALTLDASLSESLSPSSSSSPSSSEKGRVSISTAACRDRCGLDPTQPDKTSDTRRQQEWNTRFS